MLAFCLGITEEGHVLTWMSPLCVNEEGSFTLVNGPSVVCELVKIRVIGRTENGFYDSDVEFKAVTQ